MRQRYGQPAVQPQPRKKSRNSIEFRADRARIITLLKAKRINDAYELMDDYEWTDEELDALERESGVELD